MKGLAQVLEDIVEDHDGPEITLKQILQNLDKSLFHNVPLSEIHGRMRELPRVFHITTEREIINTAYWLKKRE